MVLTAVGTPLVVCLNMCLLEHRLLVEAQFMVAMLVEGHCSFHICVLEHFLCDYLLLYLFYWLTESSQILTLGYHVYFKAGKVEL